MIAYAQMIAFRFDVGVDHLIVEKLRGLRPAGNTPVVIIQQASEKRELSLLIQNLDLHEVCELPSECLHVLVEPLKIALDMRPQQRLHAVVGELRFEFGNRAFWIAQQASERRPDAGLRPGAFEQDAVEDLNLIKMVSLAFKELSPLIDRCLHNRVVIRCEWDVRSIRLEEILVDVEAWAKRFKRRF